MDHGTSGPYGLYLKKKQTLLELDYIASTEYLDNNCLIGLIIGK